MLSRRLSWHLDLLYPGRPLPLKDFEDPGVQLGPFNLKSSNPGKTLTATCLLLFCRWTHWDAEDVIMSLPQFMACARKDNKPSSKSDLCDEENISQVSSCMINRTKAFCLSSKVFCSIFDPCETMTDAMMTSQRISQLWPFTLCSVQ